MPDDVTPPRTNQFPPGTRVVYCYGPDSPALGVVVTCPLNLLYVDAPDRIWVHFQTGVNAGSVKWSSPKQLRSVTDEEATVLQLAMLV